jgi:hypothetical protein
MGTLPVKMTPRTVGLASSALPCGAPPCTTCTSPSGEARPLEQLHHLRAVSGVSGEGFSSAALPASVSAISCVIGMVNG